MRPDTQKKLTQIKRISAVLRRICKALLVSVTVLFLAACLGVLIGRDVVISAFDVRIPVNPLAFPSRLLLIGLLALWMGVLFKALYHLHRLFGIYASGEIFTTQSASQIRHLGITALLWASVSVIQTFAVPTLTQSSTPMPLHLRFDSAVIGLVTIVISWFMDAAAQMREENDLTI